MEKEAQQLAHVRKDEKGQWQIHALEEHLREVGRIAAEMAECFGSGDWAGIAGLWHDLGKYRPAFQGYIANVSGYDPDAHIEQGRVDHSTAGAIHAIDQMGQVGRVIAYLIAGHHAGLPDWNTPEAGASALENRLDNGRKQGFLEEAKSTGIPPDILAFVMPGAKPPGGKEGLHLWIRMLFSCLVDADFLDTEAFMSPDKTASRSGWPSIEGLKSRFDSYMQKKAASADLSRVNTIRSKILGDCRAAASMAPGIFSLTVPTGGGKTLSGMAFALDHAILHKKRRVIIAIPYTSIIEQTADQYRDIFGDAIIEHHSNLDPEKENAKSRLASENWDAPVVVTTNVQLLESLFAARTSRCRKLHNLIDSVIVIDEAQLLPPSFLQPVLDVLRLLTGHYGITLVLSTATQPALATVKNNFGATVLRGLDNVREIMPNVASLYEALERVVVEKPADLNANSTWESVAEEIRNHDSVLAIVNTRGDCRELFELMPTGTIHLSGLMCGEHRSKVIRDIKARIRRHESVRVISTQLVEAGVDLDFPVVYRALAGLDSIAQAAGRCNREGRLEKGRVVVFVPPKPAPKGMLRFGEDATKSVWHGCKDDPLSHQLYGAYFRHYFGASDLDEHKIVPCLVKDAGDCQVQFRTAANKFRLIDDSGTHQVIVPYGDEGQKYIDMLKAGVMERYLLRKLQRYSVNVYEHEMKKLRDIGAIEEVQPGMWAVCVSNAYDDVLGLRLSDSLCSSDPASMIL